MMSPDRPSESVRARLLAAAAREPATRPGTWSRRMALGSLVAVAWMIGMTGAMGIRPDWRDLPDMALWQTLIALIAVGCLASMAALARGRTMVGAATESLFATAWGLPVLVLALVLVVDPRGSSTVMFPGGASTVTHARACDLLTFGVALPLIGIGVWMTRGLTPGRPGLAGACLGLASATWAHLLIRIHCPVGGGGHAVFGHVLPALPLMALGALASWLLNRRQSGGFRKDMDKDTA